MFRTIALIVGALIFASIAIVLVIATTKPDTLRVERSAMIDASPEKIFPLINDLQRGFTSWSPYEKKDPDMQRTFSGPENGKGAVYEWDGDDNVGKGRLEITNVSEPSKVTMNLDFVRPFEAHNVVEFELEPQGASTNVTWGMHCPMPFVSKMMSVIFDMDQMIGSDFEAGLANLKTLVESRAASNAER